MINLKANEFLVWDELNCHEEDAEDHGKVFAARDEKDAARSYAENDSDGHTDGLYHGCPQPLVVMNAIGRKFRVEVEAEMVPRFRVVKRELL